VLKVAADVENVPLGACQIFILAESPDQRVEDIQVTTALLFAAISRIVNMIAVIPTVELTS
jgi:hypothetical protein